VNCQLGWFSEGQGKIQLTICNTSEIPQFHKDVDLKVPPSLKLYQQSEPQLCVSLLFRICTYYEFAWSLAAVWNPTTSLCCWLLPGHVHWLSSFYWPQDVDEWWQKETHNQIPNQNKAFFPICCQYCEPQNWGLWISNRKDLIFTMLNPATQHCHGLAKFDGHWVWSNWLSGMMWCRVCSKGWQPMR